MTDGTFIALCFWSLLIMLAYQWGLMETLFWLAVGTVAGGMIGDSVIKTYPMIGEQGWQLIAMETTLLALGWCQFKNSRVTRQKRRL
jgi:uncharacterized integral membrane protein